MPCARCCIEWSFLTCPLAQEAWSKRLPFSPSAAATDVPPAEDPDSSIATKKRGPPPPADPLPWPTSPSGAWARVSRPCRSRSDAAEPSGPVRVHSASALIPQPSPPQPPAAARSHCGGERAGADGASGWVIRAGCQWVAEGCDGGDGGASAREPTGAAGASEAAGAEVGFRPFRRRTGR
jgi:hypothetical protein